MKVSIITVVYNGVNTIERTLKSVLSQTYKDIEYILIDGKSIDGTIAIVNRYRKKITHFTISVNNSNGAINCYC